MKKPPGQPYMTHDQRCAAIKKSLEDDGDAWKLAALNLQLLGIPVAEIARRVNKAPNTAHKFLKSADATVMRRKIFGTSSITEIKEELRSVWPLALKAVTELLASEDPDLIVQKANKGLEILIALGAKEADKQEITHKHIIDAAREAIIVAAEEAQKEEDKKAITIGNA